MKKFAILLVVFVVFAPCEFAQGSVAPPRTKEEAIARLRADYLLISFKNQADTTTNIGDFLACLNKIVPIGESKKEALGSCILTAIRQEKKPMSADHFLWMFPFWKVEFLPVMRANVHDIINIFFSLPDYEKILAGITQNIYTAHYAYIYLRDIYREEQAALHHRTFSNPYTKSVLDEVFSHYGI